jgi:hypothetical protein
MLPESSKLLLDIQQALEDIEAFTAGLAAASKESAVRRREPDE